MNPKLKLSIKSALFVFIVHGLSILNLLLYDKNKFELLGFGEDLTLIIFQMAIFVIASPIYFGLKGSTKTPWLYTLTTAASHIVLMLTLYFIFAPDPYTPFSFGVVMWEVYFLTLFFIFIILIDVVTTCWKTIISKKNLHQ